MLATHTVDPEDLFTISAGGFSATADAFARDENTEGLWFVSMVGSQTALKAIWASLLKQPPDIAHIIRGADGMALHGGYQRCVIPYETIGTWTTKIARLPATGGWHALVYTKTAEYAYEKDSFLLLAQSAEEAPALHHRFLDRRSPLPLHDSWAGWLWERGIAEGEIVPLQSVGVFRLPVLPQRQGSCAMTSPYAVASGQSDAAQGGDPGGGGGDAMIGYRHDDGGRAAAGYRGKTGDCVVRAIAICAREDYRAVYADDGRAHEGATATPPAATPTPHGSATAKRPAAGDSSPPGASRTASSKPTASTRCACRRESGPRSPRRTTGTATASSAPPSTWRPSWTVPCGTSSTAAPTSGTSRRGSARPSPSGCCPKRRQE